jgi:hypothetical protein
MPRCHEEWDCGRPNPPAAERLCEALWAVQDAVRDLLADHGDACDCSLCYDARGVRYSVNVADDMLTGELRP